MRLGPRDVREKATCEHREMMPFARKEASGEAQPANILILDFHPPKLRENKCLSQQVCDILLQQP